MKKFGILLLALALLLSLCACGSKTETATETTTETTETTVAATPHPSELGSGEFELFSAAFTGAELFTDADGDRALRVYFDFLNSAAESRSPADVLLVNATQDGSALVWAQAADDTEGANSLSQRLLSGNATRCVLQYKLISDGEVTVTLDDDNGHSVSAWLIPNALPGAPAEALTWSSAAADTLTTELPASCTLYDLYDLTIVGGEVSDAADGGRVLNVQVDFTNNSDSAIAPAVNYRLRAYQDGVELSSAVTGTQEADETAAGETQSVLHPFTLTGDSPVLVELFDLWSDSPSAALVISIE